MGQQTNFMDSRYTNDSEFTKYTSIKNVSWTTKEFPYLNLTNTNFMDSLVFSYGDGSLVGIQLRITRLTLNKMRLAWPRRNAGTSHLSTIIQLFVAPAASITARSTSLICSARNSDLDRVRWDEMRRDRDTERDRLPSAHKLTWNLKGPYCRIIFMWTPINALFFHDPISATATTK